MCYNDGYPSEVNCHCAAVIICDSLGKRPGLPQHYCTCFAKIRLFAWAWLLRNIERGGRDRHRREFDASNEANVKERKLQNTIVDFK